MATNKKKEGHTGEKRVKTVQRSLEQMIKTIGPYLPKRDFGIPAQSGEWQAVVEAPWMKREQRTRLVTDPD